MTPNRTIVAASILLVSAVVGAQTIEDGFDALGRLEFEQAHDIFAQHARQGDTTAQIELGLMLAIGEGVPRDRIESYKWLRIASSGDNGFVAGLIETLSRRMTEDQIAEAERLASGFEPRPVE